ncbi:hypothetical protein ACI798_22080 [Geodermatophilus sp. SYSU D01045]
MRWIAGGAALLLAGCGSGPAAPPPAAPATTEAADDGGTGYASAFLGAGGESGSDDVFVHVTVFDPPDADAFGNGEFFVLGWDCLTEERVPATVAGLDSATARGELALTCGSHTAAGEVTGTAVVDLTWTAEGPGHEYALDSPDGACRELLTDRHAVVTGQVRVVVPGLGYDGVAVSLADDDDSVSRGVPACP